jgi:hypothetical protein
VKEMSDLDNIKPNYLKELAKLNPPMPLTHAVMKCVIILLDGNGESSDVSWKRISKEFI